MWKGESIMFLILIVLSTLTNVNVNPQIVDAKSLKLASKLIQMENVIKEQYEAVKLTSPFQSNCMEDFQTHFANAPMSFIPETTIVSHQLANGNWKEIEVFPLSTIDEINELVSFYELARSGTMCYGYYRTFLHYALYRHRFKDHENKNQIGSTETTNVNQVDNLIKNMINAIIDFKVADSFERFVLKNWIETAKSMFAMSSQSCIHPILLYLETSNLHYLTYNLPSIYNEETCSVDILKLKTINLPARYTVFAESAVTLLESIPLVVANNNKITNLQSAVVEDGVRRSKRQRRNND